MIYSHNARYDFAKVKIVCWPEIKFIQMKVILFLFFTVLFSANIFAQIYQEDFESYALGTSGSTIDYIDFGSGTTEVATGINENTSNVLYSSNTSGGDHYLRSPLMEVVENETYVMSFDISITNTVYLIRIRTEDETGNNVPVTISDVVLTTTNGTINTNNLSRIENVTSNSFGTTTATFTVPAGMTKAQFQVYQFGVNGFSLDNVEIDLAASAFVYEEDFESYPIGTAGAIIGYEDFSNGFSEIDQGMNGNATKVLLSSNQIGGDHFLRTSLFNVEENKSYKITLDISLTNTVYFIRIRTEDDLGNNTIVPTSDVALTATNGEINVNNPARIENVLPNSFGTSTVTFTAPGGASKAQMQIYQFGVNSFMLDNIQVLENEITEPPFWSSEAEQGSLGGDAFIASGCSNASGQAFVRMDTQNVNRLTFNNITLEKPGSYELSIEYFYKSSVNYLEFYVNGEFVKERAFLPSPWCFEGSAGIAKVLLPLREGINTIALAPVQGKPSPFLDRVELSEDPVYSWFSEAEAGNIIGGASIVSGCTNASEQAFVKIDKVPGNGLLFDNVEVSEAGYYKINIAYFGKGVNQSLNVLVNGESTPMLSIDIGNFCFEGNAKYAAVNTLLQAGDNHIELQPINGNTPTPLIDWVEVYPFTPPVANLSMTKQRMRPGETVEIFVSTDDVSVVNTEVFSIQIGGIDPSDYDLSDSNIILEPGDAEGKVSFTPNPNIGEKEIQITISSNSEEVILDQNVVNAQITSIPRTIYVSATDGDDNNDGFSELTPLKTLARTSELGQIVGDQILFKSGETFYGRLVVSASGSSEQPIVISNYATGEKPILDGSVAGDGKGSFLETILIVNKSNIEISNLHIRNPRNSARKGVPDTHANGIFLLNDGNEIIENFVFRNLTISEVFSVTDINQVPFNAIQVTGIFAETTNSNPGSTKYMENITVEDCYFSKIGKLGFWARRLFSSTETMARDSIKNRNIIFRNNTVFENGGSGIVLSNAYNSLVESNIFEYTGSKIIPDKMIGRGSGAWFFSCTNVIAQKNISRHVRGSGDSYGMHIDYGNKNVLFQYNYSEDSEGGFVEILGDNVNSIWRYNISVNDGLRENKGNTLWISDYAGNSNILSAENYIYNNSVFVGNGFTPDISLNAEDAYIYNNIFQTNNNSIIGEEMELNINTGPLYLSNNIFFGEINESFTILDPMAIHEEPNYVEPGKLESDGYRLFKSSPAIKAGEVRPHPAFPEAGSGIFSHITAEPDTDFFGNPLIDESGKAITPIGAYAGKGLQVKNLKSFAICDNDSTGSNQWLVINPNLFALEVTWMHNDTTLSGQINAIPGHNIFYTKDIVGIEKEEISIHWMDENGEIISTKIKTSKCYEEDSEMTTSTINKRNIGDRFKSGVKAMFPIPAKKGGALNILLASANKTVRISIIDLSGKILYETVKHTSNGDNLIQLDLSEVPLFNQIGFVRINMGDKSITRKIILIE